MSRLAIVAVALAALVSVACSGPPVGETDITAPTRENFLLVDNALGYSCGTLDCHGQQGRNMRVWSKYGMRAQVNVANPPVPGSGETTKTETELTYRSVVGLEPEIMSQVVRDGGQHPERLTMIRKALGTEAHKGHKRMSVGDPLDLCLTSWLAGNVNKAACQDKSVAPPLP